MGTIEFTSQQRQAARTCGRSIIVSAAAGSGKTAVLAERCAYLVSDAPAQDRCDVDRLLVLTFTDAAETEMRSRIVDALRERSRARPQDARLRRQVELTGAAQISTIHAFCLWLIRRWFTEAGIDPGATMLDAHEATLLKREVLDTLLLQLYAEVSTGETPLLGSVTERDESTHASADRSPAQGGWATELSRGFAALIDRYGFGEDRSVAAFVLRLFGFVTSLPDPDAWLCATVQAHADTPERIVVALAKDLTRELRWQIEHCEALVAAIQGGDPANHAYAESLREYVERLGVWSVLAAPGSSELSTGEHNDAALLSSFESVREQMASFEFARMRVPRIANDADPALLAARDNAKGHYENVRDRLFKKRLKARFALFSVEDRLVDLKATAPYVSTIVRLVSALGEAYTRKKRKMDVLDFADLERLAFDLLRSDGDPEQPSQVARALHRRFDYVLVDEFQDINPLQQAIIRLASRETVSDRRDNLFVVGDVKQSIYRFRLADPTIFTERLCEFHRADTDGLAISLQRNFRSRAAILGAVNAVFSELMRPGAGAIVYDEEAFLHPGRKVEGDCADQPVELHLLERSWSQPEEDEASEQNEESQQESLPQELGDLQDPARWSGIEREAHLIGRRIRDWVASEDTGVTGKPLRYRDVVVLLRAAKVNAERIASMLSAMGIPAHAGVGGSLFGTLEVRDVLAVLRVLDNPRQDIPLTAVLRNGVLGESLSEDDLVEIRCLDRTIPFHEAVDRYAQCGQDSDVQDSDVQDSEVQDSAVQKRLRVILDRIERYRIEIRHKPLADVLWSLYDRQGTLAYAGGLRNGPQRCANLYKLHELARKFGTFRRQGLHRFLRFIETLEEEGEELAVAPTIGESEDVVRVMSIHQSKGLEFPVVFVAGLGTKFNLGDRSGSMIFERRAGIGLRVVDDERMIEYPTAAHQRVADEIERCDREEELRILYVAMTRARDKLVLVGSRRGAGAWLDATLGAPEINGQATRKTGESAPSLLSIATAATPLDWLIPAIAAARSGSVSFVVTRESREGDDQQHTTAAAGGDRYMNTESAPTPIEAKTPLFEVHLHESQEMASWSLEVASDAQAKAVLQAVASCDPLPSEEHVNTDDPEIQRILSRIDYIYPSLGVTSVRAALGASEFKGALEFDYTRYDDEREDARRPYDPGRSYEESPTDTPRGLPTSRDCISPAAQGERAGAAGSSATDRGVITHRVLQNLDFLVAVDAAGVAHEWQRLVSAGTASAEDAELVDLDSLVWFVGTTLAAAIREAGDDYRREFQYIATEPPSYLDPTLGETPDDHVLVRGIVDGILPVAGGIEIVDFKTDAVTTEDVAQRAERYRPQMTLYARAMARLWRRPVTAARLVFLTPRRIVEVTGVACSPDDR